MFAILKDAFVSLEIKMLSFFVQCSILVECFFGKKSWGLEAEIIVQSIHFVLVRDLGILLFGVIISCLENVGAK